MANCFVCGKAAQSRMADGTWICKECVNKLGGYGQWMGKIRKMSGTEAAFWINGGRIVKTKILDHGAGDIVGGGGGVGRAILGGFLAGGAGAVVGATTRKQRFKQEQYTVFKVWYSDGRTEIESVEHTSSKYETYLKLIED